MRRAALVAVVALAISGAAGCTSSAAPTSLTVFAAASLTDTLPDLAAAWQVEHPASELTTSTGSSAALRAQIEQGAPADVFLSADTANAEALINAGDGSAPLVRYATNRLSLIVPLDNPAGIRSPADLARPGICIVAAGAQVPITEYAEQLVTRLAGEPGYDPAFAARYAANVCSREDNVAAVTAKISLGEGDAAIVYATDGSAAQNVTVIELPPAANVEATYAGVVVIPSRNSSAASDFLGWLTGNAAQAVLAAHGFGAAP